MLLDIVTSDLRLLGIAPPPSPDLPGLVDACRRAESGGVTTLQLRWKGARGGEYFRAVESLVSALAIPVFTNDRADIAQAAGAAGVHLGAEDLSPSAVRRFAPRPFAIGVSVGNVAEADAVLDADVDYWSVGSIFETGTKRDAGIPIGPAGFRSLATRAPSQMPVLAIGGITEGNARTILAAGAHGIAISAAIFAADDIEQSTKRLRAIVDQFLSG